MKTKQYIYYSNFSKGEKELFNLEKKCLFNESNDDKYLFSNIDYDPKRSVFIKEKLEILISDCSFEHLVEKIPNLKLDNNEYKISYIGYNSNKRDLLKQIAYKLLGSANFYTPKNSYGLCFYDNIYYFGYYKESKNQYFKRINKPFSYSNSCPVKLARILCNLAVIHNNSLKLIDPLAGAGTVVIEALDLNINVDASDINYKVCNLANNNLEYYGYKKIVKQRNICDIKNHYDVCILDIPYNVFTSCSLENQKLIINNGERIADKLIILSHDKIDKLLDNHIIIDFAQHEDEKKFTRYITITNRR